jgi:hypothetical protein
MDTLKLNGREFTGIKQSLTSNQDIYILTQLRLSGAMDVLAEVGGPRTPEKKCQDLLTNIMAAHRMWHVLAGALTEVGKKWNHLEADRNAEAFGEITDETEKALMIASLVEVVIGFFHLGERSSPSSPKSLNRRAKGNHTANAAR